MEQSSFEQQTPSHARQGLWRRIGDMLITAGNNCSGGLWFIPRYDQVYDYSYSEGDCRVLDYLRDKKAEVTVESFLRAVDSIKPVNT